MESNLELSEGIHIPKSNRFINYEFILFGIGSLLAWNAILTELTFFNQFIPKLKPIRTISFLNFAPNIILQFILLYKKNLFKIQIQLIFGLISSIVLLIIIPISVILLKDNETLNMIVTIILILIMGLINALCTSGFFAFASFFPLEMIISLSTGQGIAGILLNIIMYILLPTVNYNDANKKEIIKTIIFFSISAFILIMCLLCLIFSLKLEFFKYYLNTKTNEGNEVGPIMDNNEYDENEELIETKNYNIKVNEQMPFRRMFKILIDINLLCVFIYIVTFSIYPIAFQKQTMFNLESNYYFNTVLTIYNAFDTIGRYLVSKIEPTKKITYISVLSRGILLITIVLNYYFQLKDFNIIFTSIFLIINDVLLALTNGMGTTLCFGIAPTLVSEDLKGQAGASVSFFTIVGIFIGSVISAFLTEAILDLFK